MLPLLVWLAGCIFGLWTIVHYGFYREAVAFCVCASTLLWMVGGATWIGHRLQASGAIRKSEVPSSFDPAVLRKVEAERAALRRSAENAAATQAERQA